MFAAREIPPDQYCTTPEFVKAKKQHTHTKDRCGYVYRANRDNSQRPRPPMGTKQPPVSYGSTGPRRTSDGPRGTIECYACGGNHMKRDCPILNGLQMKSPS